MKDLSISLIGDNITLKLIDINDITKYTKALLNMDDDTCYYTGITSIASQAELETYVKKIIPDETRYDFLILDSNDEIIGESVLNEIDWDMGFANYRVAIFKKEHYNKGVGSQAVQMTINYGLKSLNLHRIELEVFDFNPRAQNVYIKAGFKNEGIKRDGVKLNGKYHDVLMFGILKSDISLEFY